MSNLTPLIQNRPIVLPPGGACAGGGKPVTLFYCSYLSQIQGTGYTDLQICIEFLEAKLINQPAFVSRLDKR